MTCPSMPHSRMQLIRVAEHLGVKTPGVPATPSPPTDLYTRDVDHLVEERLGYLYGPPDRLDHVKRPLRHDMDVDDVSSPRLSPRAATVGAHMSSHKRQLWNSHDQRNRDIDHHVFGNKKSDGLPCRVDQTLRHDRGVDDLVGELQLRNVSREPVVAHNGRTTWKNAHGLHTGGHRSPRSRTATGGNFMVARTMGNGLCTSKKLSPTWMDCNCGDSTVFCSLNH